MIAIRVHKTYTKNKFPFDLFARLIVLFQGMLKWDKSERYSHFAMSFIDETGDWSFVDASPFGVRTVGSKQFLKNNTIIETYIFTVPINRVDFLRWLKPLLGIGYGFKQIIGLLTMIVGCAKANPFGKGAGRIICNELILLFLSRFYGLEIGDSDDWDLLRTDKMVEGLYLSEKSKNERN